MIFGRKLIDRLIGSVRVGQSKPHGDGRQYAGFVSTLTVLLQSERITLFLWRPVSIVERGLVMFELRRKLLADIILSHQMRQIGKCSQRLNPEPGLIILVLHRKQRPAFHPAMADA